MRLRICCQGKCSHSIRLLLRRKESVGRGDQEYAATIAQRRAKDDLSAIIHHGAGIWNEALVSDDHENAQDEEGDHAQPRNHSSTPGD